MAPTLVAGVPNTPGPASLPGLTGSTPSPLEQRGQLIKSVIISGTSASIAAIFPRTIPAGNLVVMAVSWATTTDLVSAGTISDDAGGNTWHIGPVGAGQNPGCAIVWCLLSTQVTSANTVTLTFSSGTPGGRMYHMFDYGTAFTGLDASTSGSAASGPQSATATPAQAGDAALFVVGFNGITVTAGDSALYFGTDLAKYAQHHHTGSVNVYLASADALVEGSTAYTAKANGNMNQSTWALALLTPASFNQTVTAPAATATASAPVPGINVGVPVPAATATVSSPVPGVGAGVPAPSATATVSAPAPGVGVGIPIPAATASASAPVPTVAVTNLVAPPAATATVSSPVPGVGVGIPIPAATATVSAPVPTVVVGNQVAPPAATATSSSPAPGVGVAVPIPAATASASAPVPTVVVGGGDQSVSAPAATASASAPVPMVIVTAGNGPRLVKYDPNDYDPNFIRPRF